MVLLAPGTNDVQGRHIDLSQRALEEIFFPGDAVGEHQVPRIVTYRADRLPFGHARHALEYGRFFLAMGAGHGDYEFTAELQHRILAQLFASNGQKFRQRRLRPLHIRQFDDRLVEPSSSLGQAIQYMQRHWEKLTLFLRKAGAPLDNNICERALKKAILHRKNALFYKTENGALVGDTFMSLIYTCQLCGANPFDYLTELQRHATALAASPQDWMPWNYRAACSTASK